MKSRKKAVEDAVLSIKGEHTNRLSDSEFIDVCDIISLEIAFNKVSVPDDISHTLSSKNKRMTYVKGLVRNYLAKSPVLNKSLVPKPRRKRDDKVTDHILKSLIQQKVGACNDAAKLSKIEEQISLRRMKLANASVNVDLLPQHLRELLG